MNGVPDPGASPRPATPPDPWRRGPVELLAPAGDLDALAAAAAAGADAVYFGLPDFSARRRAANIGLADLPRAVRFLHRRRVRAYLAVNTLLAEDEYDRLAPLSLDAASAGCDAFIVQDIGALRLLRTVVPGVALHLSTQGAAFTPADLRLAAALGATRAVLPRELTLADIAALGGERILPLEVFVHGALCTAVSGRCLLSSFAGARSGNRGLCAQRCRLAHGGGAVRGRILSPGDLRLIDDLPALAAAGVDSFKIEGRLKKAAYVGAVTAAYRRALDAPARADEARGTLERVFHRPFTRGYLDRAHPELAIPDEKGNVGVPAGEVTAYDPGRRIATARLTLPVAAGDGIDLRGRGRSSGQSMPPMTRDGARIHAARAGDLVRFAVKEPCFAGDGLFLTRSDELEAEHRAGFPAHEPPPGVPVELALSLAPGAAEIAAMTPRGPFRHRPDLAPEIARGEGTPEARITETLRAFDREAGLETGSTRIGMNGSPPLFIPLSALKRAVRDFKQALAAWFAAAEQGRRDAALAAWRARRAADRALLARHPLPGDGIRLLLEPAGDAPLSETADRSRFSVDPPLLAAAALAQAVESGIPVRRLTPECRPGDLLLLPPEALAAAAVPLFGRYELATVRHDLTAVLPPGPGPHRLTSVEGDLLAVRAGRATRLYPAGFFSLLAAAPDLAARGARTFLFLLPLLDPAAAALRERFAALAPAMTAALAASDRAAWDGLVRRFVAGHESIVTERRGRLE